MKTSIGVDKQKNQACWTYKLPAKRELPEIDVKVTFASNSQDFFIIRQPRSFLDNIDEKVLLHLNCFLLVFVE